MQSAKIKRIVPATTKTAMLRAANARARRNSDGPGIVKTRAPAPATTTAVIAASTTAAHVTIARVACATKGPRIPVSQTKTARIRATTSREALSCGPSPPPLTKLLCLKKALVVSATALVTAATPAAALSTRMRSGPYMRVSQTKTARLRAATSRVVNRHPPPPAPKRLEFKKAPEISVAGNRTALCAARVATAILPPFPLVLACTLSSSVAVPPKNSEKRKRNEEQISSEPSRKKGRISEDVSLEEMQRYMAQFSNFVKVIGNAPLKTTILDLIRTGAFPDILINREPIENDRIESKLE